MAKIIPISEHFQHFLAEMKESFWGDLYGQTKLAWQRFFELQSERQRDRFSGWGRYERRRGKKHDYRNGYYAIQLPFTSKSTNPCCLPKPHLLPLHLRWVCRLTSWIAKVASTRSQRDTLTLNHPSAK